MIGMILCLKRLSIKLMRRYKNSLVADGHAVKRKNRRCQTGYEKTGHETAVGVSQKR